MVLSCNSLINMLTILCCIFHPVLTMLCLLITLHCNIHSFIHSVGMCRMQQFLVVLRSFFHSSLLCTFSCHSSPTIILPPSLTSSRHLFLGLPLNLVLPKFIFNSILGIIFFSFSVHVQTNVIHLTLLSLL